MLNPSTADESVDDPTIRKCMEFVKTWEYQYLVVTNLFALRSPAPERLYTFPEPIGEENNWFIEEVCDISTMVICAWGNHGLLNGRYAFVKNLIAKKKKPRILNLNASGQPTHPLYLSVTLEPKEWT